MTDKEIIIDGVIFNECDGCPLYDGDICTGARLDEEISEKDTNICNEHLAEQFWVVRRQLKIKEQECEELKEQLLIAQERYTTMRPHAIELADTKLKLQKEINTLKQALNEIEELAKHNNFLVRDPFCGTGYRDLSGQILNIINKTKDN